MRGLFLSILLVLHVMVCLLLVVAVLMQQNRSEGLGTTFGRRVTDNIFGAQTSSILARITAYLGVVFFILTLLLAITYAEIPTSAEKDPCFPRGKLDNPLTRIHAVLDVHMDADSKVKS